MSLRPKGLPEVPEQTMMVARAAFPQGSLAMRVRDRLAEVFADEPFADTFGVRGAPGLSPGVLSLVTVLQFAENLTDRQAAAMGRLPAEREDHYMRLAGAQVVSTRALLGVRENIRAAIDAKAMICIYGPAGHGKSFAVDALLRELAPTMTHRIQFRARPSTRDLRHELFHALGLHGRPPSHAIEFDRMLRGALEERRVLVCDEAQWLSKLCFEYLRYLWDDTGTDLTIIFTGGNGCFEMLQSEPMLESRVDAWQEIDPMPLDEVLTVVPAFHPVWADADPELIALCDREAAHGNFRAWRHRHRRAA